MCSSINKIWFVLNEQPSKCFDDDKFEYFATRWRDSGAKLIGGCCRTTPSTIQAISTVLKGKTAVIELPEIEHGTVIFTV